MQLVNNLNSRIPTQKVKNKLDRQDKKVCYWKNNQQLICKTNFFRIKISR